MERKHTPSVQPFFFDAVSKNVYVENKNKWNWLTARKLSYCKLYIFLLVVLVRLSGFLRNYQDFRRGSQFPRIDLMFYVTVENTFLVSVLELESTFFYARSIAPRLGSNSNLPGSSSARARKNCRLVTSLLNLFRSRSSFSGHFLQKEQWFLWDWRVKKVLSSKVKVVKW